jgi:hypothetical protein
MVQYLHFRILKFPLIKSHQIKQKVINQQVQKRGFLQVALKVLEAPDEEMLQLRRGEFEVLKTAPWRRAGEGRKPGKMWGKCGENVGKMWKKLGDSGIFFRISGKFEKLGEHL